MVVERSRRPLFGQPVSPNVVQHCFWYTSNICLLMPLSCSFMFSNICFWYTSNICLLMPLSCSFMFSNIAFGTLQTFACQFPYPVLSSCPTVLLVHFKRLPVSAPILSFHVFQHCFWYTSNVCLSVPLSCPFMFSNIAFGTLQTFACQCPYPVLSCFPTLLLVHFKRLPVSAPILSFHGRLLIAASLYASSSSM